VEVSENDLVVVYEAYCHLLGADEEDGEEAQGMRTLYQEVQEWSHVELHQNVQQ